MNILVDSARVIITIADIHFGATDSKKLLIELQDEFISRIENLSIVDAIVICGDFYDTKLSMNSLHAKLSFEFIKKLVRVCKLKNTKLRILKGTESHDNKQLELFDIIGRIDPTMDILVITSVMKEELFDNLKVLYIPEEYVSDKNEYYKDYFNESYNMIFGHGLFNETAFVAAHQDSEITHSKAPVFNSGDMLDICNGPIFFGHIHISQIIKNRIFYIGSFSRWCYGEEKDKGFYICIYSPISHKFKVEFVKNRLAPLYDTAEINFENSTGISMDTQFTFINNIIDDSKTNMRIILNIPETSEVYNAYIALLHEKIAKLNNIKLVINNNNKIKQRKEVENKINILLEKYSFVFDKGISYEEKISKFIKEKHNKHIDTETIRYYLFDKILK